MNILFLGGNRYFGKEILIKLLEKNHKVLLINRGSRGNLIKHKNLIFIKSDRKKIKNFENFYKNIYFDVIFDNIAYKLEDVKSFLKVFNKKFNRYIFTSSAITYLSMHRFRDAKESDWKYGKINNEMKKSFSEFELFYAKNKRKIEKFLLKKKNIQTTILRIPAVIGENDFSKKTKKLLNFNYNEDKKNNFSKFDKFQYVFKDDLVKICLKLIETKNLKTNSFNIANKKIQIEKFYNKLRKVKRKTININKNVNEPFPIPVNSFIASGKIKKELNFRFSSVDKVIKSLIKIND